MMTKEEIAPHVLEIVRVLDGKLTEEKIENDLSTYLNTYRMSLEASKRHIVRKYGGDPNKLTKGIRRMVSTLGTSEQTVDILIKVISANEREIKQNDGTEKTIIYGVVADETGSIQYTLWEKDRCDMTPGEVYLIRHAYTKEWSGQPKLNIGVRAVIEKQNKDAVNLPDGTVPEPKQVSSQPVNAQIGDLKENMIGLKITGRILSVKQREVEANGETKTVFSGIMADETGKIDFSAWHDFKLQEDEVVTIVGAYTRGWKGIPQLTFGEKASVTRPEIDFPDKDALDKGTRCTIEDIERKGGAADTVIIGSVIDVKPGSGILFRCPECHRPVMKGICQTHGQVTPVPDLRIKAILDDGTGSMMIVLGKELTEKLTGITLADALEEGKSIMDFDFLGLRLEKKLLAQPLEVRGRVTSDEYGLTMTVHDVDFVNLDIAKEAEDLISKVEEF